MDITKPRIIIEYIIIWQKFFMKYVIHFLFDLLPFHSRRHFNTALIN